MSILVNIFPEEIDKSRWLSKSQIISLLLESRQKFLTDENICQYGCDAKILGILTKEFRKLGLVEGGSATHLKASACRKPHGKSATRSSNAC